MDTVQHIAAARIQVNEIKSALDRMSTFADARNPEAMLDAICDAIEAANAIGTGLYPAHQRVRKQVVLREARVSKSDGKAVA